jgi:uncharacterized LabA/DUF88 family protein
MIRRRNKKTTYAFIDSQNLNLGTQRVGWKLDWRKFREYLEQEHGVSKAYLFVGYIPENEDLYKQMHEYGYLVVLKPTQDLTKLHSEADDKPIKGNIDAELVLYAMKELPNYKDAIIVSGDGDFFCLVEYLAEKKRLKHIMTPNYQYSSLYKAYDDKVLRIDKMRKNLSYKDIRRRKSRPQ